MRFRFPEVKTPGVQRMTDKTKRAAKKTTAKKAVKKTPKKAVTKRAATPAITDGSEAPKRVGRPPGTETKRRTKKKDGKKFAYQLLQPVVGSETNEMTAGTINGPFGSQSNALDDASIMADDNTTIVLFREIKRGRVQKTTKFVAGR